MEQYLEYGNEGIDCKGIKWERAKLNKNNKDITGQKHSQLLALFKVKIDQNTQCAPWLCLCDCGNLVVTRISSILNGHTKSCGHLQQQTQFQSLDIKIGQKYGYLTVIEKMNFPKSRNSMWLCQCECGNMTIVTGHCLVAGITKSCGCWQKEIRSIAHTKDITGQTFGLLTAESRLNERDKNGKGTFLWLCKCQCGNKCIASLDSLIQGNKMSCGCLKTSFGEYKIQEILDNHNIKYEREKTFSTCIFPESQKTARFDFYLPDYNTIIEYDGEQHFTYKDEVGWNNKDNFIETRRRDLFKNQWCEENHIILKRIPYTQKNIIFEDIMSDKYIFKESYYENYNV